MGLTPLKGPYPPGPGWTRVDLRGEYGTRIVWGWISPEEDAIVADDGRIYPLITKEQMKAIPKSMTGLRGKLIHFFDNGLKLLEKCLDWQKELEETYEVVEDIAADELEEDDVEDEVEDEVDFSDIERKKNLNLRRWK